MTSLPDACDDLRQWLPVAAGLIAEPDADGTTSGAKPGSSPPWNGAAANALYDAHALIRETEQIFAQIVTGRMRPRRGWSDRNTTRALDAIEKLAEAVPQDHIRENGRPCRCEYCRAASALTASATIILQLPAVDEAERPQRVAFACPYCRFAMVRVYPKAGRVVCIRAMAGCADADGNPPQGSIGTSQLDGTPRITWQDGLVT